LAKIESETNAGLYMQPTSAVKNLYYSWQVKL